MSSTHNNPSSLSTTGFPSPIDDTANSLVMFTQLYLHPAASRLFAQFSTPEAATDLNGLLGWIRDELMKRDRTITELMQNGREHHDSARAWQLYSQSLEQNNKKLVTEISDLQNDRRLSGYPDFLDTQAKLIRDRQRLANGLACYAQADVQPFLEAIIDDIYSLFLLIEELHDKANSERDNTWSRRISAVLAMVSTIQDQLSYTSDEIYGALQQFKEEVSDPVGFATQFSAVTFSNSWEISPDFPHIHDLPSPLSSSDSLVVSVHSPTMICLADLD
ncbi:hypothetical protein BDP27DRAFT_1428911 [Rhodocollybia butyracea]|uniref:Uncharacterized protein n=1 Tax=Rhodocollybia butyracea TaxID=206335 RepID=A0A9P5PG44_9AGAR|nr:hypothetical protein BDP27DRAFT_1428911 [Rhodocollybia butyracea]